ncbi:FAD/NAD(P)-binding protein [Actinopolyspora saharensis]|uniref:FAD-NAD(P)-binding n=1 Tax=Actinopolyspora saharensis TaxID=995062 RepID=A0A1H1H681_9ACTN|nr:FAD/NAD(P)-binding domain-containing protein [Actinopolyspora saharensis]SDR20606.1 FAD-NAD(P)-binding [Actinopolyspora saharensis]
MIREIAIVGLGPRGLSVLERIAENSRHRDDLRVVVHAFDSESPGAGSVWRPSQSRRLLMNTVASQITLFTDPSVRCDGPIVPGPSLYDWISRGASVEIDDEELRAEASGLAPDEYPSRALYGRYLHWVLDRIRSGLPSNVRLRTYTDRVQATAVVESGRYVVVPAQRGRAVTVDRIVLALGHLPGGLGERERNLQAFATTYGLTYVPPANPADVRLDRVGPEQTVLMNGLGLNFFDYLSLLTSGRGGSFERTGEGLVYHPSGAEPTIVAGSRRGVPYHARGKNQKGVVGRHTPRFLTSETITKLRSRARELGGLDFGAEVWPLITNEVAFVHYRALLRKRFPHADHEVFACGLETVLRHRQDRLRPFLRAHGIGAEDEWSWERISRPLGERSFDSPDDFTCALLDHLREDLDNAYDGNVDNPLKAALDAMRDLRNEVRQVVDHGQVRALSHRDRLARFYTPLNAFVSIGPPPRRVEELIALIESGTVTVAGPGFSAAADSRGCFSGSASAVRGSEYTGDVLIDARLPDPGVVGSDDPLVRYLLDTGTGRRHVLNTGGVEHTTGGLEVTERPYRLVDSSGEPNPGLHAFGVPTEGVHWATAAGVRPGLDSVILGDADAIARSVLGIDDTGTDARERSPAGARPRPAPVH